MGGLVDGWVDGWVDGDDDGNAYGQVICWLNIIQMTLDPETHERLGDRQLADELITFLIAGHGNPLDHFCKIRKAKRFVHKRLRNNRCFVGLHMLPSLSTPGSGAASH